MKQDRQMTIRTSVILTEKTHRQIAELAANNDVSTAWIIRYALNEFLLRYSDEKLLQIKPIKE